MSNPISFAVVRDIDDRVYTWNNECRTSEEAEEWAKKRSSRDSWLVGFVTLDLDDPNLELDEESRLGLGSLQSLMKLPAFENSQSAIVTAAFLAGVKAGREEEQKERD